MKAKRVEEIREVIWCEPWKDPQLFPDLLVRVFNELGVIATGGVLEVGRPGINPDGFAIDCEDSPIQKWASQLLEVMDLRARSGIPFDEPYDDQPPTDPED